MDREQDKTVSIKITSKEVKEMKGTFPVPDHAGPPELQSITLKFICRSKYGSRDDLYFFFTKRVEDLDDAGGD